jgi:cell division transport system permease protein
MRTQFVMSELAIGLRRNVTMTAAAIVTIMISVTLLGGALMTRGGAHALEHDVLNQIEVSVYLQLPCGAPNAPANCLTPADQASIQRTLLDLPQVDTVTYISQDDAYKRFVDDFTQDPELLKVTPKNALPSSFAVKLKDPHQFEVVNSAVSQAPGVESVANASQDLNALFHFFHLFEIVVLVITLVLLGAAVLLIYNAMLVAAFSRRRETGIMRLVGASDFYIQAPFILEGTVIGVVGTGLAVVLLAVGRIVIKGAIEHQKIFKPFGDLSNFVHALPIVILVGILLPAVASFVTLQRHMRV